VQVQIEEEKQERLDQSRDSSEEVIPDMGEEDICVQMAPQVYKSTKLTPILPEPVTQRLSDPQARAVATTYYSLGSNREVQVEPSLRREIEDRLLQISL